VAALKSALAEYSVALITTVPLELTVSTFRQSENDKLKCLHSVQIILLFASIAKAPLRSVRDRVCQTSSLSNLGNGK
jgi:hypothetical protein